jgi:hypothetical protein
MPSGVYDRTFVTRRCDYEFNRDPEYMAWRADRMRANVAVIAARKERGDPGGYQHFAVAEAISETIERTRREIIAELKGDPKNET